MADLPKDPPPQMVMPMALAFARLGFFVRPVHWSGAEGEHELAWLHYPAGEPLAYYWNGEEAFPGRPWDASDLVLADWYKWWTVLSPECFDEENIEDLCLCAGNDLANDWTFALWEDEETDLDSILNPNSILGIEGCGTGCDCKDPDPDSEPPLPPDDPDDPDNPDPPGDPGGSGGTGGGGPTPGGGGGTGGDGPTPDSPTGGTGGSGGGGGGGGGSNRPNRRPRKPPEKAPTITVTAVRTDPVNCQQGSGLGINHTWNIQVELSNDGPAGEVYSVRVTVLGEVVDQWMLGAGGNETTTYSRTQPADSPDIKAIGSGSAFGGGPACVTGSDDLEAAGVCPPPSVPSSSSPPDPGSTPPDSSSQSTGHNSTPPNTSAP